jgi:hypothetical protein
MLPFEKDKDMRYTLVTRSCMAEVCYPWNGVCIKIKIYCSMFLAAGLLHLPDLFE